jgi:hypothetical protein
VTRVPPDTGPVFEETTDTDGRVVALAVGENANRETEIVARTTPAATLNRRT